MAEHVDDELDLEDEELHAHDRELEEFEEPDGEFEPPIHDPGGVPQSLTPQGYRSVNPLLGVGAIAIVLAIVGAVLWSLLAHPRPTLAASPLVSVTPGATTPPDASMPDPTETPLGRPRTRPVLSIAQSGATPAPAAITTDSTTTAAMTTSGPPPQQQIADAAPPASEVPRAKTAAEIAADANGRDLAAASRASSRMQLESQDAQAQRDLGGSAAAYGAPAAGSVAPYPVQGSPGASTAGTEADDTFASEPGASGHAGGSAAGRPAHSTFVAARSGDPGYEAATSRYELAKGTNIPARLIFAVDSTVSGGLMKAQLTETIFDSATHTVPVLPAGTIAIGESDSALFAEARLVSAWTEFDLPNGRRFFASSNEGAGSKGEAGMSVSVDTHAGRAFGNALVGAVLQAGVNLASRATSIVDVNSATTSLQAPTRPSPTLHAYPGQLFNIVLNHDEPFDRYVAASAP